MVLSALIGPLALVWVASAIYTPERQKVGYQNALFGFACAVSLCVIGEFFRIRAGNEPEANLYLLAVEFSAGFTLGVAALQVWKKAGWLLRLLYVSGTQLQETEKFNEGNMNCSVYWILSVPIFLLLLFFAYRPGNKANYTPRTSDTAFHRAGSDFRRILLDKWKAQPNQLRSDFTVLCDANFAGLTLTEAQEKMEGAGQVFEFFVANPQPVETPKGMLAVYGGLGLGSTWISSASFQMLLFVDAQGTPDIKKVKKVAECIILNVDL